VLRKAQGQDKPQPIKKPVIVPEKLKILPEKLFSKVLDTCSTSPSTKEEQQRPRGISERTRGWSNKRSQKCLKPIKLLHRNASTNFISCFISDPEVKENTSISGIKAQRASVSPKRSKKKIAAKIIHQRLPILPNEDFLTSIEVSQRKV
jgi:hypothetical protein